ncbi:hypothetical protein DER44DRAFT_492020 [Fusarium oxysporum]|nr:hypothetical protein DER44DRAFT_492020 [Fusarium oxysporum]
MLLRTESRENTIGLTRRLESQPFFVLLCVCSLLYEGPPPKRWLRWGEGQYQRGPRIMERLGRVAGRRKKEEGRRWGKSRLMVFCESRGLSVFRNRPSTPQGAEKNSRLLHCVMGRATSCQQPLISNLLVEGCGSTDDDRCSGVENGDCKL